MTPPTTLRTRRRPRRASLLAALAATTLAFGLITAGGGTASADSPPATQYAGNDDWCHFNNGWGGNFFCGAYAWYQMPNGYWETFVAGTDTAVWTRWNSSNGLSPWVSLGGQTIPIAQSVNIVDANGWEWAVQVLGRDDNWWYRTRLGGPVGSWTGWAKKPAV
jgi:hypothetical protein